MKAIHLFTILAAIAMIAAAEEPKKPLVLKDQGSFFVGGETKSIPVPAGRGPGSGGEMTVNQVYVQDQTPVSGDQHVPVVMVHGCCLSSKTWESPHGQRLGPNEYFVRKNRSVYLADQV